MPNINNFTKWAVIACDQFTSQPDYWDKVKSIVNNSPSAYNLILPEAYLDSSSKDRITQINNSMNEYLKDNLFTEYQDSYIYVERTLLDGSIRPGIIGVIDLNEYDFGEDSSSKIRATELTVKERIPPRKTVRENASLELSHVILLCDDEKKELIEPFREITHSLTKLYDFDLMLDGGNIKGWLISGIYAKEFDRRLSRYIVRKSQELSLVFAVGDGNHSLAAAKSCYLDGKTSRYAMVELENIYDDSIKFEPIHRIIKNINPEKLIEAINHDICSENDYWPINYYYQGKTGTFKINKSLGASALIVIQKYLDEKNYSIDYIHDTQALINLSNENNNLGIEMPPFDSESKRNFFKIISESGVLPRKTFSMGHAQEKRYYLEARKIKKE